MSEREKTAAELLREVAAAGPEAHDRALARGYGVGPERIGELDLDGEAVTEQ